MTWRDDAACKGMDTEIFFIAVGKSARRAKAICASCPVRQECADYAVKTVQPGGVWGGLSERERRRVRHGPRVIYEDVDGMCALCTKPHYAKGLCNTHYARWQRYGDATIITKPGRNRRLPPDEVLVGLLDEFEALEIADMYDVSANAVYEHRRRLVSTE